MVRPPYVDSNGMKKGAWSEEEDNKLRDYVLRYGHWNWRLLPKFAGLARCGKSCRLRWVNYLKPGLKKGNFTKQEEDLIIQLHAQLGNKWSAIASKFPGRTDNEIKNFWHTRVDKRRKRNPAPKNSIKDHTNHESKPSEITLCEATSNQSTYLGNHNIPITEPQEEYYDFPPLSYGELSSPNSSNYLSALDWINAEDDHMSISSDCVAQPIQGDFWTDQLFSSNISDSQCEISYASPREEGEMGGFYDPLLHCFDQWHDHFV